MTGLDPDRIALRFVNEINRHDTAALSTLMSTDVRFVDGLGQELWGKDRMCDAWTAYFAMFPDYRIVVRDHLTLGPVVAFFGTASGTYAVGSELPAQNRWSIPAAWRVVVREGLVTEWQVYADNDPVRKLVGPKIH
ncbi:MAG: nuclear transport factor 2 family protein [Thermoplasmata archaeon]|jgi:ketosteroid isomerase-like protein